MKDFIQNVGKAVVLIMLPFATQASISIEGDTTENIINRFDEVSYRWDEVAETLEEYEGLSDFCVEKNYRAEVISLLKEVHHFDSLIYNKLQDIAKSNNNAEVKKTLKQIEELESEFSIKEFSNFLSQECKDRRIIERTRKELKGNIGQDGYDGQQQLLENKLYRYMHNVTFLVDHIRKHIHHLHLEEG